MAFVSAIILAAGKSTRFGSMKLGSLYNGRILFSYILDSVIRSDVSQTVAVVNSTTERFIPEKNVDVVLNNSPERGMGHSISVGISRVSEMATGAIIIPADMPNIGSHLINKYITRHKEFPERIISGIFNSVPVVPVLFPRPYFGELFALDGDKGAKSIVMRERDNIYIELNQLEIKDIDLPSDLN